MVHLATGWASAGTLAADEIRVARTHVLKKYVTFILLLHL
jgi:hypothetical protein